MSSISVFAIPKTFTNLSVPSVIFAADDDGASWYGSLRGGVQFKSGEDAQYYDGSSRWGIKGSNEVSEGLTAVYRFETNIDNKADQAGNGRLNYVGLSGGFGSFTLGNFWSASYNHAGVIRDFPNWHTSGDTSGRLQNALSYAFSSGAISLQIDAVMDGKRETGGAVDQVEFGMTAALGDYGKLALGYTEHKDEKSTETLKLESSTVGDNADTGLVTLNQETGAVTISEDIVWRIDDGKDSGAKGKLVPESAGDVMNVEATGHEVMEVYYDAEDDGNGVTTFDKTTMLKMHNGRLYDATPTSGCFDDEGKFDSDADCGASKYYFVKVGSQTLANENPSNTYMIATDSDSHNDLTQAAAGIGTATAMNPTITKYGSKSSHISAEFGLAGVTLAVGYTQTDSNDPKKAQNANTTFVGASGSIGDTGLNWGAWSRNKEAHDGTETQPWTVGLSKALGDGAKAYIEHGNMDDALDSDGNKTPNSTVIGLVVNF